MMAFRIYNEIGRGYASLRRPDPSWVARIRRHIEDHHSLVNVGAGSGSYEPSTMTVVALEPSQVMIRQRMRSAAPAVYGIAEQLPFKDRAFDVALAVLTVHHWADPAAGLAEMRRISRKQVVVTWNPNLFARRFWLVRDYLPEAAEREKKLATLEMVSAHLEPAITEPLPVPADCTDGFFGAYWRRPHAYLDPMVRGAISGLALLEPEVVSVAMERLKHDLDSGRWLKKNAEMIDLEEIDLGYRILVAEQ